jgi:hypothetical protein
VKNTNCAVYQSEILDLLIDNYLVISGTKSTDILRYHNNKGKNILKSKRTNKIKEIFTRYVAFNEILTCSNKSLLIDPRIYLGGSRNRKRKKNTSIEIFVDLGNNSLLYSGPQNKENKRVLLEIEAGRRNPGCRCCTFRHQQAEDYSGRTCPFECLADHSSVTVVPLPQTGMQHVCPQYYSTRGEF